MGRLYFITTNDVEGHLVRWILNIPYNIIGIELDSSIPGEDSYIYFLNLFTYHPPSWQPSSLASNEWKNYPFSEKGIQLVTYYSSSFSSKEDIKELKRFITKHCLSSSNSHSKINHWKDIIHGKWHPTTHISFLSPTYISSSIHTLYHSPNNNT